jgi:hypothetical protein
MLTLGSILALAACGSDTSGKGRVAIVMSATGGGVASAAATPSLDATETSASHTSCRPGQALQAAEVTFASILARTLDGALTDVAVSLPESVDLLSLVSGKQVTLPVGFLPPGTYDQLVVVMTKVEVTLLDGTKIAITPPGGGWTAIVPVAQPFTVAEGQTTTITLRFRKDLSFTCLSGIWEFRPKFEGSHDDGGHHD